ncbi:MAG: hypothetical protein ISS79_04350 [Phycisphaerae bacterium]|nr:hypothetical protein [Phycisphaerae bacterium]
MKKMLCVLVLSMLPVFDAEARTFTVDCDNPGTADYDCIQCAIDAASDGDTIVVKQCTYVENIRFKGKAITVTSLAPDIPGIVETTRIIAAGSDYSVKFDFGETSDAVLTGFTITGRGIYCYNSSPVISKNIITECDDNAITGENDARPLIIDNTITSNNPVAIFDCHGDIIGNKIIGNGDIGAVRICAGDILDNEISNNFTTGSGGALFQCSGEIMGNVISDNEALISGGAICECSGSVMDNTITRNKAGSLGGALSSSTARLGNNIIAGNQARFGSAMANCFGLTHNNTITGNRATDLGTLYQCYGIIENNIIAFNEAPTGGGIYGASLNEWNCFWGNIDNNLGGGAFKGAGDIETDPCFVSTGYWDSNGTGDNPDDDFWVDGDYHVLSEKGRWNPVIEKWVYDDSTSPCVDAGYELWDWKGEYWPHGARINQGRYGGTSQASMSLSTVGNVADLNLDGWIDFQDLMLLAENWPYDWPLLREDLDRNGGVDLVDYAMLAENWHAKPPPSPNPMRWAVEPNAISVSAITMDANEAVSSDGSGVEYYFKETTGNPGGDDRDWDEDSTYTDLGLSSGLTYCYAVKARNKDDLIETEWSAEKCATTWSPPNPSPMTWAAEPNAIAWHTITMRASEATATDGSTVEYQFEEISGNHGADNRDWNIDPNFTDTGLYDANTYCYRVQARNTGNGLETDWSELLCARTPLAPPPTPSPMAWMMPPTATYHDTITMVADQAAPGDGSDVEYYFENVTITDGSHDRDWDAGRVYTDTGLSMKTEYCYKVKARNSRNRQETQLSEEACATTPCNDSTPPYFPAGYWESPPCEEHRGGSSEFNWWVVMTAAEAADDSNGPLQYRFICTNDGEKSSGWQTSRYHQAFLGFGNKGLKFCVEARDLCENVSTRSPEVVARRCP